MNETALPGACAGYEYELVELLDGSLGPERARVIRLHVEDCARCRHWLAEFSAIDARLANAIPRPTLSPDFEAGLRARLAAAGQPPQRGELTAAVEREHRRLIEAIGRGARRHVLLDAVGSVAATACVLIAARGLLARMGASLDAIGGAEQWVGLGIAGAAIAAATLAWAATRGGLPTIGWQR
jgi:anti-sigma factor RsiW